VTRLAITNGRAAIELNGEGARLINGNGALVLAPTGVAGVVSGELSVEVGGLEAGGTLVLRLNNTGGAVDETITVGPDVIRITFGAGEGNLFAVALTDASILIGGVVRLQGSFSFTSQGDFQVFAGTDLLLFIGEGLPTLEDGSLNPLARGLLISGATVGLVKQDGPGGARYALVASGTVSVLGIAGLELNGGLNLRLNTFTTAINQSLALPGVAGGSLEVNFSAAEVAISGSPFSRIEAPSIALDIGGQKLFGDLSINRIELGGESVLHFGVSNLSASIGAPDSPLLSLVGGEGDILVFSTGIAANIAGSVQVGIDAFSLGGDFAFQINTTAVAIDQTFTIGDATRTLKIRDGPYVMFKGTGVSLHVAGQTLTGNFEFVRTNTGAVRGNGIRRGADDRLGQRHLRIDHGWRRRFPPRCDGSCRRAERRIDRPDGPRGELQHPHGAGGDQHPGGGLRRAP
jgi:hypothetical protein